jgi:adenylate cyclase
MALFVGLMLGLVLAPYFGVKIRGFDSLESATVDYRVIIGRKAPVNPEIVFLSMDAVSTSTSLDSMYDEQAFAASRPLSLMRSSYPYPRELYALICDRLFGAGAKAVGIDVLFLGPSADDTAWASAIDRYRDKLVLAMNISYDPLNGTSTSATLSIPAAVLLPDQDPFDDRLGYVNYWQDSDDVVRDVEYETNMDYLNGNPGAEKEPMLYSLAARLLQKGNHSDLIPKGPEPRTMRFAGPPLEAFKHFPLYQIFDAHNWEHDFKNGDYFRDKIVLIGPLGNFAKDKSSTPYGLMDGSEIHLNAINDALQNDFLQRPSTALTCGSVIAACLLAFALAMTIAQIAWRFLAAVAVIAGYIMALIWAYNGPGWLLPAVAPMGVFCGATGVGFIYDFTLAQIEKLRLRTTFERYNSKNVVKYLLDHTASYKEMLAGTRKPVTVLFSDIRGFTTIVETTADSQQLVNKLNEYFTAMVDCVFRYDGSLDKFMGDGIMAVWGNTPFNFGPQEDAVRAVRAALAMLAELRRLNAKWRAEGKTEWQIGIGLNHGQVIVGDMGSQQHKEFAVVGDAVNLGSRLESLTKEYHLQILLGERVAELVSDQFHLRSVDFVQVKGKTRSVQAFTVLGEKSEALPPDQQKFLALYEEGISSFRRREFVRAKELFAQALQLQPGDDLAAQYLAGCVTFIEKPPDASWTGVRVMTQK